VGPLWLTFPLVAAGGGDEALLVEALTKSFELPHERMSTIKERVLHPRSGGSERFDALRDVSFEVKEGEPFGIVGRNGSGKSTLLKCLAGIYRTDGGEVWVRGAMAPFIELGVGFNPELSGRDNAIINGVMLGLSPRQARERYAAIIDFAELERFQDLKLKNYSSGMQVRLAFAAMVQVDADILLIDEVLAVGDASFQQKCHDTLAAKRDEGVTILLVTHDMETVERFCRRALLLENGRVVDVGEPRRIARRYNELNFDHGLGAGGHSPLRAGDRSAEILDAWFADADGARKSALTQGLPCSFHALVEIRSALDDPTFGVALLDDQQRPVFATDSRMTNARSGRFEAGERVEMVVEFENFFAPGRYYASPRVARSGPGSDLADLREGLLSMVVTGGRPGGGVVDLPHDVSIQRRGRVTQMERVL
jgi:ABC-type polysaccharide/polyol phosphate transport system ATPase subunit